jgi:DNA-binding transcriptional LysR family regulator
MQLPALKYFAAVARSGSLRHASEVFDIVPSAISRQIAQLESTLAVTLFERSSRGMTLTEAGKLLLEFVEDGERRVGALSQRLDDLSALRRGTVRLAVVEGTAHDFLPRILERFSRLHPGIEFRVSVCATGEIPDRLLSQAADIALAFNSPSRDDLVLRASMAQPMHLICAPGHRLHSQGPLSMKQLDGVAAAVPDRSFGIRRLIDNAAAAAGIRLRLALETDSLQLILKVVASSDLVSFMPPMTFTRELAAGTVTSQPLQGSAFARASIDVLTARSHDLSHAARSFLAVLTHAARERPARGPRDLTGRAAELPETGAHQSRRRG